MQQQCKLSKERKKDSCIQFNLCCSSPPTPPSPNHPSLLQTKSAQLQTKGHIFLCTHDPETKKKNKNPSANYTRALSYLKRTENIAIF
jgi:hypothetical protein